VFSGANLVRFVVEWRNYRCFRIDRDIYFKHECVVFVCPRDFDISGDSVITSFCPFQIFAWVGFDIEVTISGLRFIEADTENITM
jgi:hypothetical protein